MQAAAQERTQELASTKTQKEAAEYELNESQAIVSEQEAKLSRAEAVSASLYEEREGLRLQNDLLSVQMQELQVNLTSLQHTDASNNDLINELAKAQGQISGYQNDLERLHLDVERGKSKLAQLHNEASQQAALLTEERAHTLKLRTEGKHSTPWHHGQIRVRGNSAGSLG